MLRWFEQVPHLTHTLLGRGSHVTYIRSKVCSLKSSVLVGDECTAGTSTTGSSVVVHPTLTLLRYVGTTGARRRGLFPLKQIEIQTKVAEAIASLHKQLACSKLNRPSKPGPPPRNAGTLTEKQAAKWATNAKELISMFNVHNVTQREYTAYVMDPSSQVPHTCTLPNFCNRLTLSS